MYEGANIIRALKGRVGPSPTNAELGRAKFWLFLEWERWERGETFLERVEEETDEELARTNESLLRRAWSPVLNTKRTDEEGEKEEETPTPWVGGTKRPLAEEAPIASEGKRGRTDQVQRVLEIRLAREREMEDAGADQPGNGKPQPITTWLSVSPLPPPGRGKGSTLKRVEEETEEELALEREGGAPTALDQET